MRYVSVYSCISFYFSLNHIVSQFSFIPEALPTLLKTYSCHQFLFLILWLKYLSNFSGLAFVKSSIKTCDSCDILIIGPYGTSFFPSSIFHIVSNCFKSQIVTSPFWWSPSVPPQEPQNPHATGTVLHNLELAGLWHDFLPRIPNTHFCLWICISLNVDALFSLFFSD